MQLREDRIDEDEFEQNFAWDGRYRTLRVEREKHGCSPAGDVELIRQYAVAGVVKAQIGWAKALLDGYGVAPDHEAAFRWFKIAAKSGDNEARNMTGRCFELGIGVSPQPNEAARWYKLAADSGDAWAQFNLASLLAQGRGVHADIPGAVSLLVRSARQGNEKAMNMLGRLREDGVDARAKPRSAEAWYRRAAKRGCFRGQFHYARFKAIAGDDVAAAGLVRASLAAAPEDFRDDALDVLRRHGDVRVRALAAAAAASSQRTA